jgi:hypothetical protein
MKETTRTIILVLLLVLAVGFIAWQHHAINNVLAPASR